MAALYADAKPSLVPFAIGFETRSRATPNRGSTKAAGVLSDEGFICQQGSDLRWFVVGLSAVE